MQAMVATCLARGKTSLTQRRQADLQQHTENEVVLQKTLPEYTPYTLLTDIVGSNHQARVTEGAGRRRFEEETVGAHRRVCTELQ